MTTRSLLLLVPLLAVAACTKGGGATLPPPAAAGDASAVGVRTLRPKVDAAQVVRATGELRARNEAVLSAEVSGRILRFHADVGDRVKKGDVLVVLADSSARIQLQQARAARAAADAALRNAQNEHRRTRELASGDAASPAALERAASAEEQATAAREQAAAAVAAAEDQLAKHALRAPFDGVVTARTKSAGEYVAMMPPTPVIAIVDLGSVEVRAAVPEAVVDLLAPGAELDATVSPSGKPFKAKIRAVGASVEPATRTVDVRAVPVGAPFRELRPGALVELSLGGTAGATAGVFLPSDVVQSGDAGAFVWTVEDDRVRRRDVRIERLGPGTVRVVSGLAPTDLVVAEGGGALADGALVRVLQ